MTDLIPELRAIGPKLGKWRPFRANSYVAFLFLFDASMQEFIFG